MSRTVERADDRIVAVTQAADTPSKLADVLVLAKVRLNSLVVVTTAGGYYMAAPRTLDPVVLIATCVGTALVAGGASAINQIQERDIDRLMNRTRLRPVADGRMSLGEARALALGMSAAGLLMLGLVSPVAAAVALATLLFYIGVYTPLKPHTSLATIVGAVPGALPPIIGWTAAGGSLAGPAPWTLFLVMFLWQLPHFLAISWLYRDDYARAGLPMLAVIDRDGRMTGRQAAVWAATLIGVSLLPGVAGLTGLTYAAGALVLGAAQFAIAVRFARHRTPAAARLLFLASIVYLPLLWGLMVAGRS